MTILCDYHLSVVFSPPLIPQITSFIEETRDNADTEEVDMVNLKQIVKHQIKTNEVLGLITPEMIQKCLI